MKLFILFLIACFIIGLTTWNKDQTKQRWFIAALCLCMCVAYLLLNQI